MTELPNLRIAQTLLKQSTHETNPSYHKQEDIMQKHALLAKASHIHTRKAPPSQQLGDVA